MRNLFLILSVVLTTPIGAAFAEPLVRAEYYIVRDTLTKKCAVTDKTPMGASPHTIAVDIRLSFQTKADAETSMNSMKLCMNTQ